MDWKQHVKDWVMLVSGCAVGGFFFGTGAMTAYIFVAWMAFQSS